MPADGVEPMDTGVISFWLVAAAFGTWLLVMMTLLLKSSTTPHELAAVTR